MTYNSENWWIYVSQITILLYTMTIVTLRLPTCQNGQQPKANTNCAAKKAGNHVSHVNGCVKLKFNDSHCI